MTVNPRTRGFLRLVHGNSFEDNKQRLFSLTSILNGDILHFPDVCVIRNNFREAFLFFNKNKQYTGTDSSLREPLFPATGSEPDRK